MNPLFKKVRTQAEKDELLRQARIEYENIPGELKHLVAASDEEFLGKLSESIIVDAPEFIPAREATQAEKDELTGRLLFSQIYGQRADSDLTGIPAIDDLMAKREREEFEKL